MKKKSISVRLVGKPGALDEEMRHLINALDATCFPQDKLFNKDACFWWIVYVNGVAMGFAGLRPEDESGFLCRAGVCTKASGLGLQRKLIDARMRYAKRVGMKKVETYVADWNFKSIANLIRAGLRITHLHDEYVYFEMKI